MFAGSWIVCTKHDGRIEDRVSLESYHSAGTTAMLAASEGAEEESTVW